MGAERKGQTISTHRIIQVSGLLDSAQGKASLLRRCALSATTINNHSAAIYFANRAQKCDDIVNRCYLVIGRDYNRRAAIAKARGQS